PHVKVRKEAIHAVSSNDPNNCRDVPERPIPEQTTGYLGYHAYAEHLTVHNPCSAERKLATDHGVALLLLKEVQCCLVQIALDPSDIEFLAGQPDHHIPDLRNGDAPAGR